MFNPYMEEKIWGRALHVFASTHAAVSCLEVREGFQCSRHYHQHRVNLFAVQSGVVVIETWFGDDVDIKILNPGDTCAVGSGVLHRFRVLQSGKMTEVYWPDHQGEMVQSDDIIRLDTGSAFDLDDFREELGRNGLL